MARIRAGAHYAERTSSNEALRVLRAGVRVAQKMGARLGACKVLLEEVRTRREAGEVWEYGRSLERA